MHKPLIKLLASYMNIVTRNYPNYEHLTAIELLPNRNEIEILQKEELVSIIKHNILSNNIKYSLSSIFPGPFWCAE